jgi:LPPG:FO 2-phospho-L-lactate transferase
LSGPVVVLAGGTGGAKLARGMLDVVGAENLVVIANPGDDIEIYGAYVSPDPDLVTFWLADRIDARGWGLAGDTFAVMDGLRDLGVDVWFNLGDRDLAIGLERSRALRRGATLTEAHQGITRALGVRARVLPASDVPVRTRVLARGRWWPFQEFMIRGGGAGPVDDVDFRGARAAPASPAALEAVAQASAVVIGPSNPVVSIAPILETGGMRAALEATAGPVLAVSPIVGGRVLKGPTAAFMEWAGRPLNSDGVAGFYAGLLDGLVADSHTDRIPVLETSVLMDGPSGRRRLAEEVLSFARGLT